MRFMVTKARQPVVESSWNVMAHGDAREEKWRGNKRMEWVTSKRHMTAEHRLTRAVQPLQADMYSSPARSRLNWPPPPRGFKCTCPFRRKAKSGFCACAITFQTQSKTITKRVWNLLLFFFPIHWEMNRLFSLYSNLERATDITCRTRGEMWLPDNRDAQFLMQQL
jgi:hypothetical protein